MTTHALARRYMNDPLSMIEKRGDAPAMSAKRLSEITSDTRRTFETVSKYSAYFGRTAGTMIETQHHRYAEPARPSKHLGPRPERGPSGTHSGNAHWMDDDRLADATGRISAWVHAHGIVLRCGHRVQPALLDAGLLA